MKPGDYKNNISYCFFRIFTIHYQNKEYVKCRGAIFTPSGELVEGPKCYKLCKSVISDWRKRD